MHKRKRVRERKERGRECIHTRESATVTDVRERKERGGEGKRKGEIELVVHYTYVYIHTQ